MRHIFIILSALILCLSEVVSQKQCTDCVAFIRCPRANELAMRKRDQETTSKFQEAFCGTERIKGVVVPKVCCSNFEDTIVEDELEKHPNRELLSGPCGQNVKDRIVGGKEALLYELPWMALISHLTPDGLKFQCGGSLIHPRYVLTAAHCVHEKRIAGVRIGELDINEKYDCEGNPPVCESHLQDIRVENFIVHEQYRGLPKVVNDIALLRLRRPVDLSYKNARTICLPLTRELREFDLNNKTALVAGWGVTENGTDSSKLLKVEIPILSSQSCSSLYNRYAKPGDPDATENQLCAGTENKDSCNGDSGGPLIMGVTNTNSSKYVQFGVVSHGPQKCGSNFPGVYTEVSKYMKWILDNIRA